MAEVQLQSTLTTVRAAENGYSRFLASVVFSALTARYRVRQSKRAWSLVALRYWIKVPKIGSVTPAPV
jgi:hypothetical protein